MSERPRVLVELGEELDRAAQRRLTGARRGPRRRGARGARGASGAPRRRGVRRPRPLPLPLPLPLPSVGGVIAALAAASAVVVAVAAIVLVGHRHSAAGGAAGGGAASAASPRGEIVDRDGQVLVGSRRTIDVQIVPAALPVPLSRPGLSQLSAPPGADRALYDRLAGVLGIKTTPERCRVVDDHPGPPKTIHVRLPEIGCDVAQALGRPPSGNVTVAIDVARAVVTALSKDQHELPGVSAQPVYLPTYPHGDLAAQALGYTGPVTPAELQEPEFRGVPEDEVVGQTGLRRSTTRISGGAPRVLATP